MTPKLRFPEFRDREEWLGKPLGEMAVRVIEKVGNAALTPVSITAGQGFVSQVEKFGRDISGVQYKNYILLRKGDFAYNKGNSKSYPQGCIRRLKEFDQAAAPSAFVSFRLHDGYVPEFFEGLFEKNAHGRQLIKFITSSARSDGLLNISPDEFFSVNLPMPQDPAEQQKIAECLGSLDGLIAAEGRKLAALRDHKRGLMQQLFPQPGETKPRLRFPEFRDKGEWEVLPLCKLAKRIATRNANTGQSRVLTNSAELGVVDQGRYFDREIVTKGNLDGYYIVDKGDFVYNPRISNAAPVGPVSRNDLGTGVMSPLYTVFRFAAPSTDYFAQLFKTSVWHPYLKETSNSGARHDRMSITTADFLNLPLPVPSADEQQRIADCLSSLDAKISAQAAQVETLKQHKRGLMQQLFPAPEEQI